MKNVSRGPHKALKAVRTFDAVAQELRSVAESPAAAAAAPHNDVTTCANSGGGSAIG